MIRINEKKTIENSVLVNVLLEIMEKPDAERVVNQLAECQKFNSGMKNMITDPDEIQVGLEKKTDKELFLDRFKNLYFNCKYCMQEAIQEANRNINLTDAEVQEILKIIVSVSV